MADEQKTGNEAEKKEPVTFTDEQQAVINDILDKRFAKVTSKHKSELESLKSDYEKKIEELATAKEAKAAKDGEGKEADDENKKQFRTLLEQEKARTKQFEDAATTAKREATDARAEALRVRKEVAMSRAAAKQNFYELETVLALTDKVVEWDEESKNFVVKENGVVKQNASLQPLTLEEFYLDFASKRPYLVNGDLKSGANSTESTKSSGMGLVKTKADLKNAREKSDFIQKFGLEKFEALPLK